MHALLRFSTRDKTHMGTFRFVGKDQAHFSSYISQIGGYLESYFNMNVTNFDYKAANYLYRSTHFSNCSVAISILQFLNDQKQNATESEIYGYIIDSLQEYLQDTSQRPPAVSEQFWSWARGDHHNEFGYYAEVRDYISTLCGADACRILGWDGSPDLAGVGVITQLHVHALTCHSTNLCRCWPHTSYRRFWSRYTSCRF